MSDVPCITYMALYILSMHIIQSNSKGSTVWRLDPEDGKIVQSTNFPRTFGPLTTEDTIFDIITSTIHVGSSWTKTASGDFCTDCHLWNITEPRSSIFPNMSNLHQNDSSIYLNNSLMHLNGTSMHLNSAEMSDFEANSTNGSNVSLTAPDGSVVNITSVHPEDDELLDCGKPVNFTYYDNLLGVSNRQSHPHVPELQMELIFKKKTVKDFDVDSLERKLKKAKREKPKSVKLYNQIGNFWRIKGDTQKSIECFRRALAVSPDNAEVLLNLARVLFNLQYLDDALKLALWSLDKTDKNAWQQHFTLGEIFKAFGHYQNASYHLRSALELKPEFEPAHELLKDIETETTIHFYTLVIIFCLVMGVLLVILSGVDREVDGEIQEIKVPRHFNRAIAMRSIKLGMAPRGFRYKGSIKSGGNSGG